MNNIKKYLKYKIKYLKLQALIGGQYNYKVITDCNKRRKSKDYINKLINDLIDDDDIYNYKYNSQYIFDSCKKINSRKKSIIDILTNSNSTKYIKDGELCNILFDEYYFNIKRSSQLVKNQAEKYRYKTTILDKILYDLIENNATSKEFIDIINRIIAIKNQYKLKISADMLKLTII